MEEETVLTHTLRCGDIEVEAEGAVLTLFTVTDGEGSRDVVARGADVARVLAEMLSFAQKHAPPEQAREGR